MRRATVLLLLAPVLSACRSGSVSGQDVSLTGETRSQLMEDVRWLADDARAGRRAGSEESALVRAWLVEWFAEAGLEATTRPFDLGDGLERANVVAVAPGSRPDAGTIVVTAHYDHLGVRRGNVYNGADDNASGTAALLAIAEWLVSNPPGHRIVLAALDAEESGLRGAEAFVADPPIPLDQIVLNVNMDMVGRSDAGELYAAGPRHFPALRPPLESVAARAPVTLRFGHDDPALGGDDWTDQSDHAAFYRRGIPFVYFGVEDHADYHRPTDDVEGIQPEFFAGAVETVIMAIDTLDEELGGQGEDD